MRTGSSTSPWSADGYADIKGGEDAGEGEVTPAKASGRTWTRAARHSTMRAGAAVGRLPVEEAGEHRQGRHPKSYGSYDLVRVVVRIHLEAGPAVNVCNFVGGD